MLAFIWRGLVVNVLSMIAGGVAGFLLSFVASFVAALMGTSLSARTGGIVGGISGFAIGIIMFWVYVRWLFVSDLAGFRLALYPASDKVESKTSARDDAV